MKEFKVKVPATVANLGPGFDVMGFAVKVFLTVSVKKEKGSEIKNDGEDALSGAFISVAREEKREIPEDISLSQIENDIPRRRGLGSSAAARVGGVMIADRLFGLNLDPEAVGAYAAKLEGHPDNAVPSASGGLTICYTSKGDLKFSRINVPPGLKVVAGIPDMEIDTLEARAIMPEKVSVKDAVYSVARASLLVKAFEEEDFSLLEEAMKDRLHQPHRKKLIPGFDDICKASIEAGAYGTAICGSGPGVFSFAGEREAEEVAEAIVKVWEGKGVKSRCIITEIASKGACIIE